MHAKNIRKKRMETKKQFRSPVKRKILLLLQAGFAMSLTPSLKAHGYVLRELAKEWHEINHSYLKRTIRQFYVEKLVDYRGGSDGTFKVILTKLGEQCISECQIDALKIEKPKTWDKRWHLVIFDIPEKRRIARDALRNKLRALGFEELQKSVWALPFPCQKEIKFVAEFFKVEQHIHYIKAKTITNTEELKLKFGLK